MRPSFSINSLSAWTTRIPRLTCVSEGNPFRRLLLGVKGLVGVDTVRHKGLQSEMAVQRSEADTVHDSMVAKTDSLTRIAEPHYAARIRLRRLQPKRRVQSIRENPLTAPQREWIDKQMQFVHQIVLE